LGEPLITREIVDRDTPICLARLSRVNSATQQLRANIG
jgi:hypothetical protein